MPSLNFPVNPTREQLYAARGLYNRFDLDNELTLIDQLDFKIYKDFIDQGGTLPKTYYAGMIKSLHDYSIWNCVQDTVNGSLKGTAAIMGGHRLERKAGASSEKVASIGYALAQEGHLMIGGGRTGEMEATHADASCSEYSEQEGEYATRRLSAEPALPPDFGKVYSKEKGNQTVG